MTQDNDFSYEVSPIREKSTSPIQYDGDTIILANQSFNIKECEQQTESIAASGGPSNTIEETKRRIDFIYEHRHLYSDAIINHLFEFSLLGTREFFVEYLIQTGREDIAKRWERATIK